MIVLQWLGMLFCGMLVSHLAVAEMLGNKIAKQSIDQAMENSQATSIPAIVTGGDAYLPDFSYAGYKNGQKALPDVNGKIFNVLDFGAVPNDGIDDSQAVLRALQSANAESGAVVLKFPAGQFILSEIIYIERSDFALQGAGSETVLFYPRPLKYLPVPEQLNELSEYLVRHKKRQREPRNNLDLPFSLYAWSGGYIWTKVPSARGKAYLDSYDSPTKVLAAITAGSRGQRKVEVDDSNRLKLGQVFKIEWYNLEGENGSILKALYGNSDLFGAIGSHHWAYPQRALTTQMSRIVAIDGNTVTLADPLLMDADPRWQPRFIEWPHLENVVIKDLTLAFPNGVYVAHHVEEGYNALYLTGLYDSYVQNLRIINADSGILNDDNANLTIDQIVTTGAHKAHYTVHMGSVYNVLASNIRVENQAVHPLSFNTYSVKSVYKDCEVHIDAVLDQHSGANHQNLFDNIKVHIDVLPGKNNYPLFSGGGAAYWKPSHGRFSTFYNIDVQVSAGYNEQVVTLSGPKDGIEARLLGIHGNRTFELEYAPDPYVEQLNQRPAVPSLYDYQLQQRLD